LAVVDVPTLKSHAPHLRTVLHEPGGQTVKKRAYRSLQEQDTFGLLQTPQSGVAGGDFGDEVHHGATEVGSVALGFGRGAYLESKKLTVYFY
jgi:hypothetical protein